MVIPQDFSLFTSPKVHFLTTFNNFKHDCIIKFYWSSHIFHWTSYFFIGPGWRTGKFCRVCLCFARNRWQVISAYPIIHAEWLKTTCISSVDFFSICLHGLWRSSWCWGRIWQESWLVIHVMKFSNIDVLLPKHVNVFFDHVVIHVKKGILISTNCWSIVVCNFEMCNFACF